jgi:hypothetical protein
LQNLQEITTIAALTERLFFCPYPIFGNRSPLFPVNHQNTIFFDGITGLELEEVRNEK